MTGNCKLKAVMVYPAKNSHALKGYDKDSLPVHWYTNSSGWMTGTILQSYTKASLVHNLKEYCRSQDLPFCILVVVDSAPAHPHILQDLHMDIKFVFMSPNTTSLLQPMDQGVIKMFKAHCLQKTWHAFRKKCCVSLSKLEKAAQALEKSEVELQKDVVRRHWKEFTICYAVWHVSDAWKEVTQSCIRGAWKMCLQFAVYFRRFNMQEKLSEQHLSACSWCARSAWKTSKRMTWTPAWSPPRSCCLLRSSQTLSRSIVSWRRLKLNSNPWHPRRRSS